MKRKIIVVGCLFSLMAACFTGCSSKKDVKSEETTEVTTETTTNDATTEVLSEEQIVDLDEELLSVEEQYNMLVESLKNDNLTQSDMNVTSGQIYTLWDDELNSLWERLMEATPEERQQIYTDEQLAWISDKEEEMRIAGSEFEGGSMQPLIENDMGATLTHRRCYVIAKYLAYETGAKLTVEYPIEKMCDYVDRQGTEDDIYSELVIYYAGDVGLDTELSLYRLSSFEGSSKRISDTEFEFVENDGKFKGIITISGGDQGAKFVVSESNTDLVNVGDTWEFPDYN